MKTKKIKKGFTLIEILVVLAISAVILSILLSFLNNFSRTQALDKDYLSVVSLIEQAKSASINSKQASQYGVYFASSSAVLFKGLSYISTSSSNQIYNLNSRVSISSLNFVGSSSNQVVFDRLTGYANASGTISISLQNSTSSDKIIRIYKTGTIEYK